MKEVRLEVDREGTGAGKESQGRRNLPRSTHGPCAALSGSPGG